MVFTPLTSRDERWFTWGWTSLSISCGMWRKNKLPKYHRMYVGTTYTTWSIPRFWNLLQPPQGSVQLLVIQKTPLPNCENQHPWLRIIAIWQIPKSGSMVQFKSSSRWVSDTCPSVVFGGATRYHFWWTHWVLFVAIFGGFGHGD